MRIVNEHAHIVQASVDLLAEVAECVPLEELDDFDVEYLPHLQRVTRCLRGDEPGRVADAIDRPRQALGRPLTFDHSAEDVRAITFGDIFDTILEGALIVLTSEYEQTTDGEWIPLKQKVGEMRADARSAFDFLFPTADLLLDYARDFGDKGRVTADPIQHLGRW